MRVWYGMEIISLIISIVALTFSILQFFFETCRQRNESTLSAYSDIQIDCLAKLNSILEKNLSVQDIYFNSSNEETRQEIDGCLAEIERFSVGVNCKVYSIKVLKRIGGSYLLYTYENVKDVIVFKEERNKVKGKHYNEFKKLVEDLKK